MKRVLRHSGFTLIELLVVIAITGALASLILSSVVRARTVTLRTQARTEAQAIATALSEYESRYGRLPALPGLAAGTNDVTFGWDGNGPAPTLVISTNAGIIAILQDEVAFRDGRPTVNEGHVLNPQGHRFLNAQRTGDVGSAGVGPDGEYRDPWGQPYIISIDYSLNDGCRDAVYSRAAVSRNNGQTGLNGLFNPVAGGASDDYQYVGRFLVWSKGQDRRATIDVKATAGENKNNVLHWQ